MTFLTRQGRSKVTQVSGQRDSPRHLLAPCLPSSCSSSRGEAIATRSWMHDDGNVKHLTHACSLRCLMHVCLCSMYVSWKLIIWPILLFLPSFIGQRFITHAHTPTYIHTVHTCMHTHAHTPPIGTGMYKHTQCPVVLGYTHTHTHTHTNLLRQHEKENQLLQQCYGCNINLFISCNEQCRKYQLLCHYISNECIYFVCPDSEPWSPLQHDAVPLHQVVVEAVLVAACPCCTCSTAVQSEVHWLHAVLPCSAVREATPADVSYHQGFSHRLGSVRILMHTSKFWCAGGIKFKMTPNGEHQKNGPVFSWSHVKILTQRRLCGNPNCPNEGIIGPGEGGIGRGTGSGGIITRGQGGGDVTDWIPWNFFLVGSTRLVSSMQRTSRRDISEVSTVAKRERWCHVNVNVNVKHLLSHIFSLPPSCVKCNSQFQWHMHWNTYIGIQDFRSTNLPVVRRRHGNYSSTTSWLANRWIPFCRISPATVRLRPCIGDCATSASSAHSPNRTGESNTPKCLLFFSQCFGYSGHVAPASNFVLLCTRSSRNHSSVLCSNFSRGKVRS